MLSVEALLTPLHAAMPADPARAAWFAGPGAFLCGGGGDVRVPRAAVNDGYCDCEDGSDEPGTAACANGSFFCANAGYRPQTLRSAFVDDGTCDCCDGSDEPAGRCADVCLAEGDAWRRETREALEEARKGFAMRSEALGRGGAARSKKLKHLELSEAELLLLEEELADLKEATGLSKRKGGGAGGAAKQNRGQEVASRWTRDPAAAGEVPEDLEKELATDKNAPWKKNLGMKCPDEACATWRARHLRTREAPGGNRPEDWDDSTDGPWESPRVANPDYVGPDLTLQGDKQGAENAARFKEAHLKKVRKTVDTLRNALDFDFGDQEFNELMFGLAGECVGAQAGEYRYTVCLMDGATQEHVSTLARTRLGNAVTRSNDTTRLQFKRGASCPGRNEPRTMTVRLKCAATPSLEDVTEPETCHYSATMKTFAVCSKQVVDDLEALVATFPPPAAGGSDGEL